MLLPNKVRDILDADIRYNGFVLSSLAKIEGYMAGRSPYFFPEYTDHGTDHTQAVINTAIGLATEQSISVMNAADMTVMIVAMAIHDLGMHLTRAGFETLVAKDSAWRGTSALGDLPWDVMWQDFFAEAVRFDGKQLLKIFGPGFRLPRELPRGHSPWDEYDILLVGEFLRRNHPRLAHDIALYGLPSANGSAEVILQTNNDLTDQLHDLIGLVARSHGKPLRVCIDYLDGQYGNKVDPRQVSAAYLMVLLRIADYFQIQSDRASKIHSTTKIFRSPFSAQEWRVHQSVNDISNSGQDPQALFLQAEPDDIHTFLLINKWKNGLQIELDTSWAVLGEIYGRQPIDGLGAYGLKIRRVKTNLDDIDSFRKKVAYLPEQLNFSTADTELLSLLVAPLYGGRIIFGVRELLQNSIDSVKEIKDLIANGVDVDSDDRNLSDLKIDVRLSVECDKAGEPSHLIIEDAGCGMDAAIIQKYFLRAGASFRHSETWKRDHETEQGTSRVTRSGRFGVGALAAFLLGEEIKVTTRHYTAPADEALSFSAKIDSEALNVVKTQAPIGTKISIGLSSKSITYLRRSGWRHTEIHSLSDPLGWFFQREPIVKRYHGTKEIRFDDTLSIPGDTELDTDQWKHGTYNDFIFHWKYKGFAEAVFCNGIYVSPSGDDALLFDATYFSSPSIQIIDRRGNLALNLQRDRVEKQRLPFEPALSESLTDAFVAHAFANFTGGADKGPYVIKEYPGTRRRQSPIPNWFACSEGLLLNSRAILKEFGLKSLVIGFGATDLGLHDDTLFASIPNGTCVGTSSYSIFQGRGNDQKGLLGSMLQIFGGSYHEFADGYNLFQPITYISKKGLEYIAQLAPGQALAMGMKTLRPINGLQQVLTNQPDGAVCQELLHKLISLQDSNRNWMIVTATVKESAQQDTRNFLAYRWKQVVGQLAVPINVEKRDALASHVEKQIPAAMLLARNRKNKTNDNTVED